MNWDLTIPQAILHAEKYNFDGKLVSRELDGSISSTTYGKSIKRSKKLANALKKLGVNPHDRVATIAWNNSRHFETYFAVSGMGAILHTLNPRYSPDQLIYILNHAEDEVLIVDPTFIPLVESVQDKLVTVKTVIIASSKEAIPENNLTNALSYDDLIQDESDEYDWHEQMKMMQLPCVTPQALLEIPKEYYILIGQPFCMQYQYLELWDSIPLVQYCQLFQCFMLMLGVCHIVH